jgi:hypothetical protein
MHTGWAAHTSYGAEDEQSDTSSSDGDWAPSFAEVFISHAAEQKSGFVDFLMQEFNARYPAVTVFLDDYSAPKEASATAEMSAALEYASVGESLVAS